MGGNFVRLEIGEGHDNDLVAGTNKVGGGAVGTNNTTAARSGDDISFMAGAVGQTGDQYVLIGQNASGVHKVLVDADAAVIIEVGVGYCGTMYF